jgi:competence CoiA-like predicted nuclease
MQSAIDRRTGYHIYAALIDPDVWDAEYRCKRPWNDGLRLECPACGGPVYGKSSHDELAQVPVHFAHLASERCPYTATRRESDAHIRLKQEVARIVEACGWQAQPEVPGPNWRADLLASPQLADVGPTGRLLNLDVVYASLRERRVAFEVRVSRQSPMNTRDRSREYEKAGVEVVWLLGWNGAEAWGHPRAVSMVYGDLLVSTGYRHWQSRGGWVERTSPLSLAGFIK